MEVKTKGFCKYCGKEYTKSGMLRHLSACKDRESKLAMETGKSKCGYFQITLSDKYKKAYWLIVEASEDTTLKELDQFIRDIWVECCGHLSAFTIRGIRYESCPDTDRIWGPPSKSMNVCLRDVVGAGDLVSYEYDYGSATDLELHVHSRREGYKTNSGITILSRNNPPEIVCSNCGKNEAEWVEPEGYYRGLPFWCEECLDAEDGNKEGEDWEQKILLPICNSPRMGVCGYEGSDIYPDQFEPDKE